MASSKKPQKNNVETGKRVALISDLKFLLKDFFLSHHLVRPALLVAYSGGADSVVLLHALHQLQKKIAFHLTAMHVHHGLSPHADDWARFCEAQCADLSVPIETVHVQVDGEGGIGVEAAARHARYKALDAAPADFICLGHHQDDQAETFLLQLSRGAGVKGLAGMGQVDVRRRLFRPFLNVPRADLLAYAEQHQLRWINDESNEDLQFDRNFMRHELMPVFRKKNISITKTLARSATHMAEASTMLDELAQLDAALVVDAKQQYGVVNIDALHMLSNARQANLIRWWLARNDISMPSAALLQQVLRQLKSTKSDAAIKIKVNDALYVMRYKGCAYLVQHLEKLPPVNLLWQNEEVVVLPNASRLFFTKIKGKGIAYQRGGTNIKLRIKNREGGERFKPELGRPRRSLKTIMQLCEMPPWQREQLPLIFMDETLVIVPNIGVDANLKAASHEMGLTVSWKPYSS